MTIEELYSEYLLGQPDVDENGVPRGMQHLMPILRDYSSRCDHVTEIGVRNGRSTVALLAGGAKKQISYDKVVTDRARRIETAAIREGRDFHLVQGHTLRIEIEPTELLFLDNRHTRDHLSKELDRHADKASRYLVFHDIVYFGLSDQNPARTEPPPRGLIPAVMGFMSGHHEWCVDRWVHGGEGLLVLKRRATK
jgi:hypothetical protein